MSREYHNKEKDETMTVEYDESGISKVLVWVDAIGDFCDVTHWLMDLKSVRIASKNKTPEEKLTITAWNLYQEALVSDAHAGEKDRFVKPSEAI